MAVGLRYGREDGGDSEAKAKTYAKVDQLLRAFQDQFGSLICRELTGCDFLTPEGDERFKRENLHVNLCAGLVSFAVRETLALLR